MKTPIGWIAPDRCHPVGNHGRSSRVEAATGPRGPRPVTRRRHRGVHLGVWTGARRPDRRARGVPARPRRRPPWRRPRNRLLRCRRPHSGMTPVPRRSMPKPRAGSAVDRRLTTRSRRTGDVVRPLRPAGRPRAGSRDEKPRAPGHAAGLRIGPDERPPTSRRPGPARPGRTGRSGNRPASPRGRCGRARPGRAPVGRIRPVRRPIEGPIEGPGEGPGGRGRVAAVHPPAAGQARRTPVGATRGGWS